MQRQMTRVAITGMGVVAPNAHGVEQFAQALRNGVSGLRFEPRLAELGFCCQVAGAPEGLDSLAERYFEPMMLRRMDPHCLMGSIAALDAWADAGLARDPDADVDWDTGIAFGFVMGALHTAGETLTPLMNSGKVRRIGSSMVEKTMGSAVSAQLSGMLGVGGPCSTVSSACASGLEAVIQGVRMIREGHATRAVVGGSEAASPYVWAGFESMRVLCGDYNDRPEAASRPLSASAAGFIPGAGAGALVLESLDVALARGARIYAEIAGTAVNCGGQRNGGSMTIGNAEGRRRCIRAAVADAGIRPEEIDLISGHLTATIGDAFEVCNWREALELPEDRFPLINAPKSMIGHTIGAAGAIESVASVVQLHEGFVHPSLNCEDLHPQLEWCAAKIPHECLHRDLNIVAKSAFGFGDVNTTVIFRRYEPAH
jgi:3-oxoacyl-(acyl-carrier-protein) synthase